MMNDVKYKNFVRGISSEVTKGEPLNLYDRLNDLDENFGGHASSRENFTGHLLTAALGLSGETGEFNDHVKKLVFHNKDLTLERYNDMVKELGDVMWYVMQACIALDVDLKDIVEKNQDKLKERHQGTEFTENYKS
jgi:NTP pyrophosphatase (non-canonical NTP hydrolase)